MFVLLKRKNFYEQEAAAVYKALLAQVRRSVFYGRLKVPDTLDGRFDLLLVHLFIVMHAHGREEFNQALFDETFKNMDQNLRQAGIGDMGVPKHMRRMMKAFNGRMHAYEEAAGNPESLAAALARNLYGTLKEIPAGAPAKMATYMISSIKRIAAQPLPEVLKGKVSFAVPGRGEKP